MNERNSAIPRRVFLTGATAASMLSVLGGPARAQDVSEVSGATPELANARTMSDIKPREPNYTYEIQRTEAEWRERLSDFEYSIMREMGTEPQKSSPLWNETREGQYRCKGCDQLLYWSETKKVLDKGWTFFRHSEPDAVLTGIDATETFGDNLIYMLEVHCRRCGSHLGHVVWISNEVLHCINGAALKFELA